MSDPAAIVAAVASLGTLGLSGFAIRENRRRSRADWHRTNLPEAVKRWSTAFGEIKTAGITAEFLRDESHDKMHAAMAVVYDVFPDLLVYGHESMMRAAAEALKTMMLLWMTTLSEHPQSEREEYMATLDAHLDEFDRAYKRLVRQRLRRFGSRDGSRLAAE